MSTTPTLEGQTVLIIGGTSGIGFGVALASLNSGAATVIVASSQSEKVDRAVKRLHSQTTNKQGTTKGLVIDAKDLAGVEKVVKQAGTINHLVFTSGDTISGLLKNITQYDIPEVKDVGVFDVRFWAAVQAAKSATFAPGGSITFTSGVNSSKPAPGWSLAAGVGMAITGITRGLAVDLAPSVRVNCISPGWIDTEIMDAMMGAGKQAVFEQVSKKILVNRVGTPEDIAEAYLFVMKCGFITGQTIGVDGGQLLSSN